MAYMYVHSTMLGNITLSIFGFDQTYDKKDNLHVVFVLGYTHSSLLLSVKIVWVGGTGFRLHLK